MIINPDHSRTDGVANAMLERLKVNIPILLLSRIENIENLNQGIFQLMDKEYVVVDYIENGWDYEFEETLVVGDNTERFTFLEKGWDKIHELIKYNPPKLYFKRELLEKDRTDKITPIEYPNWQPDYPLQLREEFNARPISTLNYWGRSHESRLIFHGEIWKNAARKGYAVCDNIYTFNHFMQDEKNPNKWVTLNIPHYARIDISELMKINALSKTSVSLPGCGIKCFRSTGESIVSSVMVLPEDDLAYSYPLVHNQNCIKFKRNSIDGVSREWDIIGAIETALNNDNLYDIYLEGKKIADFYRIDNYINHLEKIINEL